MQFIDLQKQQKRLAADIKKRTDAIFERCQFIMGPEVAELEDKLASYVGVEHSISVSSGSDALLIAMMAAEIGAGDEVITTPFSFIASSEVIALLGATPVFVDIEPDTYNIDPTKIEAAITGKTRAILAVSLYGQCADYEAINQTASRHDLIVIEDAAQSFGGEYQGKKSCGLTTVGCTSFFPTKPLGCYGDGGACFTNDNKLAERMRRIRIHGQSKRYYHPILGLNGRLDTLQAGILLSKFSIFEEEIQMRNRVAEYYNKSLASYVKIPKINSGNRSAYAQYTVFSDRRNELCQFLKDKSIPTAVHYPTPLYRQPVFKELQIDPEKFPVTERAADSVFSLPMHPYLDFSEIDEIAAAMQEFFG